jgi:hypothetical protein
MVEVAGEVLIRRPVNDVFNFVADQRNEPQYNPDMKKSEKLTEGPIGVGTTFRAQMLSGRRAVWMTVEFTQFEPPNLIAENVQMSSMDLSGSIRFDQRPDGTLMKWSWDLKPRGLMALMSPLVGLMGRRLERRIWTNLKHLMEEDSVR